MKYVRTALVLGLLTFLVPALAAAVELDTATRAEYFDDTPGLYRKASGLPMWSEPVYGAAPVEVGDLGSVRTFFHRETPVQATLLASGRYCSVYVKGPDQVSSELPESIVAEFDKRIWPGVLDLLGEDHWHGRPVTILLVTGGAERLTGFTSPLDGFPKSVYRYSNEDALVVVELPHKVAQKALWHLLSCQFAYLVTMTADADEALWVRSGVAHYAGFANGYGHAANVDAFLREPVGVSLVDWPAEPSPAQLGAAYLFTHYLVDRFGEGNAGRFLAALLDTDADGVAGVAATCGIDDAGFAVLFGEWCAANAVNSRQGSDGKFGYRFVTGTVKPTSGGSLLGLAGAVEGRLPRWSASYIGFEQNGNWSPDFPTIHDQITFAFDKPGVLLWGVNGWKLPPAEYVPAGSETATVNGRRCVRTPLTASSVAGLFQAELGPFKHVARVDTVDFQVVLEGERPGDEHHLPISHDQNLSLPAVEVAFKGQSGWFGGDKTFRLSLALLGDEGDTQIKRLPVESNNSYKAVLGEFGVYYTRMVLVPVNVSGDAAPGSTLTYTFNARLVAAKRDFERCLHLQVKLYESASRLYKQILANATTPTEDAAEIKRRYMMMSRQYVALTEEVLGVLKVDLDNKVLRNFDTLNRFAYTLPKAKIQALRALVDKAIPLVRAAIKQQNSSGVTPSVELDMLLFKLSNLRAYVYEAGDSSLDGEWTDDPDDTGTTGDDEGPISPITDEDYIAVVGESVAYLSDLPVDAVIAHDVLNKILGAFIISNESEIVDLLKALGLNINIDFTSLPFSYILDLIKLKSYTMDQQRALLEQYSQGLDPEDRESLHRLYLAQQSIVTGFKSGLCMAEDAAEGVYDVIDLAMGACKATDHVMSTLEHVPIVGKWARKLKVKIIQRIIYGLNNAIQFVTSRLQEPWRSRVNAVCNALTTVYIKWKDIQIDEGFGGIDARLFAKIAAKVFGKTAMLMPPKVGFVALTQDDANRGATMALNRDYYGTYDQAMKAVVDDLDPDTEKAVLENVIATTTRKQKLSLQERQIANFAGSVSQVAQYMHMLDPTSITKIVSIVAGAFAGGLQVHSVVNSVVWFYHLPGQVEKAVNLSFNPTVDPALRATLVADLPWASVGASTRADTTRAFGKAVDAYGGALQKLRANCEAGAVVELNGALEGFEDASYGLRKGLKLMSAMNFKSANPEDDFVHQALLKENFASADLFARTLDFSFKPDDRRRKKALLDQIGTLEAEVGSVRSGVLGALTRAQVRDMARLDHMAPAAVDADCDTVEVRVSLLGTGARAVTNVTATLVVPPTWRIEGSPVQTVASVPGQGEAEVTWTVRCVQRTKVAELFSFQADSDNGGSTCGVLYLAKKKEQGN